MQEKVQGRRSATTTIFTVRSDPKRYALNNELRSRVFIEEMGWPRANSASQLYDQFDSNAIFVVVESPAAGIIGGLRLIRTEHGFPHRDLFEAHLRACKLDSLAPIVSFNALAVRADYRGKMLEFDDGITATAASRLLEIGIETSAAVEDVIAVATVLNSRSRRVFERAGFRVLDAAVATAFSQEYHLQNVGLVTLRHTRPPDGPVASLGAGDNRLDAQLLDRTARYFDERNGAFGSGASQRSSQDWRRSE